MTKNDGTPAPETTALVPGRFTPEEMAAFLADGFSESKVIKVGSKEGQYPTYIGVLIGPGKPMPVGDPDGKTGEVSMVATWVFKPVADTKANIRENVTHVMMCSMMLDQELGRIYETAQRNKKRAFLGIIYNGQIDTRKGHRVNDYRIAEKYVD